MPYAISIPWNDRDCAFVKRHSRGRCDVAIADYMFQAAAFSALADPGVPTAIVMHDLFHARETQDATGQNRDSVERVGRADEIAMLGRADAVIAIQAAEAAFVTDHVPGTRAILAPMAAHPVETSRLGRADRLLFVGSNTAPNVVGLQWFFDHVWSQVRAFRPDVELDIAGSVARAFPADVPPGVRFLGLVDDLAPLYVDAGVVLSPLTFGSGLKIKLIEALAQGKAMVVSSVTLQGVETEAGGAVRMTDNAADFARDIVALLDDDIARSALAERALLAARRHFSPVACYSAFVGWADAARRR